MSMFSRFLVEDGRPPLPPPPPLSDLAPRPTLAQASASMPPVQSMVIDDDVPDERKTHRSSSRRSTSDKKSKARSSSSRRKKHKNSESAAATPAAPKSSPSAGSSSSDKSSGPCAPASIESYQYLLANLPLDLPHRLACGPLANRCEALGVRVSVSGPLLKQCRALTDKPCRCGGDKSHRLETLVTTLSPDQRTALACVLHSLLNDKS